VNVGYNARLQLNHFDISGSVANQNYDYYNDGRMKYVHNTTDIKFDRSYAYDHVGRLSAGASGGLARGDNTETPYQELFGYDAFSNLNYRYTGAQSQFVSYDYSTYTNNRHNDWGYDADGRNTDLGGRGYVYDAAGQMTSTSGNMLTAGDNYISAWMNEGYDGDGAKAKEVATDTAITTTYYLTSSVLGGAIVEELNGSGQKQVGYIYAGRQLLAQQTSNAVTWKHNSPAGASQYNTLTANSWSHTELDPLGADVTYPIQPPPDDFGEGDFEQGRFGGIMSSRFSSLLSSSGGCTIDGTKGDCGLGMTLLAMGAATIGTGRSTIGLYNRRGIYVGVAVYNGQAASVGIALFGQGSLGFLPAGASLTQAEGGPAIAFPNWFTALPEYAAYNGGRQFGSMEGVDSGMLSVKSAQMFSALYGSVSPQDPTVPPRLNPQVVGEYRDIETPCKTHFQVMHDIRSIEKMVHGKVTGWQLGARFPGAQMNLGGQSFQAAVNTLKRNGFTYNPAPDHPEGEGYDKKFGDGLWYHVIVEYPKDYTLIPPFSTVSNPDKPTPQVTAHCHATNPLGVWHLLDTIF